MGFFVYFFEQAGLDTTASFDLSMVQYVLGCLATIGSWFLMMHFGRRTLYLTGLALQFTVLMIVGFLSLIPSSNKGGSWAIGGMLLAYTIIYDLAVGSVCYSLVAEMPASRLRTKTVVLARNAYNLFGLVNNVIIPYMLNPHAWNWKAKSGFFWAGLCFLCFVWTYFSLPELKGRTYGELDILFERRVSARKFASTVVDAFHGNTTNSEAEENEKGGVTEHEIQVKN
jgi:SP family general alpha glucoside:H+ symporter-like MFS transporter